MRPFGSRAALLLLALGLGAASAALLLADAQRPTEAVDHASGGADASASAEPRTGHAPGVQSPDDVPRLRIDQGSDSPAEGRAPGRRRGTAALRGRITVGHDGAQARLAFQAGANRGTSFATDADGSFAVAGLHPGFGLLSVQAGGATCTRPISLRHRGNVEWNLDFGAYGRVAGRVRDPKGQPILGVRVALDGVETTTDPAGFFSLPQVASGEGDLVLTSSGLASYREAVSAARRGPVLDLRMQRGCRLQLTLGAVTGARQPATVYLVPSGGGGPIDYPWHLIQPLQVLPGSTVSVDDLPPVRVAVYAIHARAQGTVRGLWLQPDAVAAVAVEMQPVGEIRGRVTQRGQPIAGATVVLETAQPLRSSLRALGDAARHYRWLPFEIGPPGRQEARTDGTGSFVLGDWQDGQPRVVEVTLPQDGSTATRALHSRARRLEIDLDVDG